MSLLFIRRTLGAILLLLALGSWSPLVSAGALEAVDHAALPGNKVQLKLRLDAPPSAAPLTFTVDNPARIAIDLPNTALRSKERIHKVGIGQVQAVNMVEAEGRTRVVVNLVKTVPYTIEQRGNDLILTVESGAASMTDPLPPAPARTTAPATAATAPSTPVSAGPLSLENVDFRRGDGGEAQVVVRLSSPDVAANVSEQGGTLIIDFPATALPEALNRKLDVADFATPAKLIDTFRYGNGTRMVVTPNGEFEQLAYQADNVFTLELRPLSKEEAEAAKKERLGYTGERLSLNFQNIEVRAVLQLIADFTEQNLVASDTVGGNVTLRLKNVPWDQALEIVLKTKGLGLRQTGNVLLVAPQEELAQREKLELESKQKLAELAPLKTEFVQVNYAKAGQIATLLKSKENKLLSDRGNVTLDERTNTLLVQDTAERLADIRRVVETLDIPVRQVLIESRVVVATQQFSKDLGVRFGLSRTLTPKQSGQGADLVSLGGKLGGDVDYGGTTSFHTDGLENYIVNLPVGGNPAGALGLAVGKIGTLLLQLELQAAQNESRVEVISAPRVVTANQKEAIIEQGQEIPFTTAVQAGGGTVPTVQFKKAVLSLKVTPQITPDERLIMDLEVHQDAVNRDNLDAFGNPTIDTNQAKTQVLVDNGETVVLGGVFVASNGRGSARVPFFGDLPYVGWLFKSQSRSEEKRELLIFVTPKIIKETLAGS